MSSSRSGAFGGSRTAPSLFCFWGGAFAGGRVGLVWGWFVLGLVCLVCLFGGRFGLVGIVWLVLVGLVVLGLVCFFVVWGGCVCLV